MSEESDPQHAVPPALDTATTEPGRSYREILKSSALIGGSTAINIVVGIVRTKVMAVLLGPAGYGLMGALQLVADLSRSVAQLGVNSSGIRQIAESAGTGDLQRTARTAAVLRGTALVSAVLGAVALAALAPRVSELTFASTRHAADVTWVALAVFFGLVAGGQNALVQGMRRIGDLAKMGIIGTVVGTLASIALVHRYGERGIVPALVATAAASVVTGWWYRRKIELPRVTVTVREAVSEASALVRLGLAFMGSGLLMLGASYVVRIIVLRDSGLEAAGLYHAAWTIGGMYVGFVLQAMGADFYPRLVRAVDDPAKCNRLVNEQATVSLLLAAPGVIGTLAFAPLVVSILYSASFGGAVDILRWICLGMALRVVTWPIGFIVVASGRRALFFGTELAWALVNVALSWVCVSKFGVPGAGIAFFLSYVFHGLMIYPVVRRLTGFRWSHVNVTFGATYVGSIALVFAAIHLLPPLWATACGACATLLSAIYSIRMLTRLLTADEIPRSVRRVLTLLQLQPQAPETSAQEGRRNVGH